MIPWPPGITMKQMQERLVELALEAAHGNKMHAARLLRVSIRTIRNYVEKYPSLARFKRPISRRREDG
jgi:transcriptional regulator with AAA-type ATPase domain